MVISSASPNIDLPAQGTIRPRRLDFDPFLAGGRSGSVLAYHGIPFAQPPTGSRRWRVPQGPLPHWNGVRRSVFPNDPVQSWAHMEGMMIGRHAAKTAIPRDEDCLYLNVWLPIDDEKQNSSTSVNGSSNTKRPVMVWVYGGAFVVGNTSRPMYDPARLAFESGCIVVSLPYRVGSLGFLGSRAMAADSLGEHPLISRSALTSSDPWADADAASQRSILERTAGNWGLWDLVAGLLWVQHSIGAFDGDADNITLFGESAGSIAIHYLLLSPVVPRGLFHKAILQSGVVLTVPPATPAAAQANYDRIAAKLVPASFRDEVERLEYLRTQVDAESIHTALQDLPGRRPRSEYTPRPEVQSLLPERREEFEADPRGRSMPAGDMWGPVWDGAMVDADVLSLATGPLPPRSTMRNGMQGVYIGYTADEGTMFNLLVSTSSSLAAHTATLPSSLRDEVSSLYSLSPILRGDSVALTKSERSSLNRRAFIACATLTGDALFHGPILSYLHTQASTIPSTATKEAETGPERVPIYAYVVAHRPSYPWLERITNIPDLAAGMGALHTVEIPLVFGFSGRESHTWTPSVEGYGVDPSEAWRSLLLPKGEGEGSGGEVEGQGMTEAERHLSQDLMRCWGGIASSSLPSSEWGEATTPTGNLGDISLRFFGNETQISHRDATIQSGRDDVQTGQRKLRDLAHFSSSPLVAGDGSGGATLEQRVRYWTTPRQNGSGTTPQLVNHYGYHDRIPEWRGWQ